MAQCRTKIEWNGLTASLLSWTEAMSAWSFSIPAGDSCPMAVYEPSEDGSKAICSGCYASIGRYNMPNVLDAQWIRFQWLRDRLRSSEGYDEIVDTFIGAIKHSTKNGYFRIHDSGDFFSPKYTNAWYDICQDLPDVKFWAPTRSYHKPGPLTDAVKRLATLPNVTIRPSALYMNQLAPQIRGLALGSGVLEESTEGRWMCPKSTEGGSCESTGCRHCWESPTESVYYLVHGHLGKHKLHDIAAGIIPVRRAATKEKFAQLTVGATV